MKELIENTTKTFESIKHIDENGTEFWYARELMQALGYNKWENFEKVILKAKNACENSNINLSDHFADVRKMVSIGSNAKRKQNDYKLFILFFIFNHFSYQIN